MSKNSDKLIKIIFVSFYIWIFSELSYDFENTVFKNIQGMYPEIWSLITRKILEFRQILLQKRIHNS